MFSGIFTALVTPFKEDGELDYDSLDKLVDFQIKNKVDGLVPMGTTGESPTVSHVENMEVVERVIRHTEGKIPVIAGTGSNSTSEAIRMTKIAKSIGATASLQVAPYYNKPTQEGLYRHYMEIANTVDLPMVVYNVQGRTSINIENETMLRLAEHPNIVAVKDASGNIFQMMDLLKKKTARFSILSGDDNLALPLTLLGGNGVISVASNIIPGSMVELISSALKGNLDQARSIHFELLPLFKAMFIETNPIPVKFCLAKMGLISPVWRLPLCEPTPQNCEYLEKILKAQVLS